MRINLSYFYCVLFFIITQILFSQELKISGKVIDQTGIPISGANITIKENNSSTNSGNKGEFEIIAQKGQTLIVTFLGMKTVQIKVKETSINIQLLDESSTENLVVVGYGTQSKKKLTDNIARVTSKDIQQIPVSNVQNALVGKLAGVQITQTNGKVDGGINIRVRGAASISAGKEPLYVLDGIPLITDNESNNGSPTNPLLTLSTSEIESIDVLKDASSAAIYGSRGANGVVIITTKKGKEGKANFTFNTLQGISSPTHKKKYLNADQYIELQTEASMNRYGNPDRAFDRFDSQSNGADWRKREIDTNWQDLIFQTGYSSETDFSVSGNSGKTNYFFSGAYNKTKGIIVGNALERFNARSNVSQQISDRVKLGMNIGFSRSIINRLTPDRSFTTPMQAVAQSPLTAPYLSDGTPNRNTIYENFLFTIDGAYWKTLIRRITGKLYGEIKILPGLKYNSDFAYDLVSQTEDSWYGLTTTAVSTGGEVFATNVNSETYVFSNYFSYDKILGGKHSINAVIGIEPNKYHRRFQSTTGVNFPNDGFKTIDGGAEISAGSANETGNFFLSEFLRTTYTFDNKYIFKASIRNDASSRFGENNQSAIFPAFSAGWIVSQENFLKNSNFIPLLKLKGSWGKVGNAEIGNFSWRQLYASNSYNLKPGLTFYQPGNNNLTWEKSDQLDLGIEFSLFNKVNIEIDYYDKNTSGLLFNVPIPISSGASNIYQNIGKIRSNGFEFTINTKNISKENFKWTSSLNITTNQSKVKSLPNNDQDIVNGFTINRVGQNVSAFYLAEYAGVDPSNGDALFYKDIIIHDLETNTEKYLRVTTNDYSEANRIIKGNPFPTLMSGFTNTMNFYGIDLSFTLQGEWGASIYNTAGKFQESSGSVKDNQTIDQMNRWQKPRDITNVPQARWRKDNGNQESTRYLHKADFVRVRNITIGYSLPKSIVKNWGMNTFRMYFSGVNLLTFTNYNGSDPESRRDDISFDNPRIGEEFYSAPPQKTIAFGLNLNF